MNKRRGRLGILLLAIALSGCGGGGNGLTQPSVCLSFAASGAPTDGTVTVRTGSGDSCSALPLEVLVTGVNDVYAASFRMTWDASVAEFASASAAGSFLASGGVGVQLLTEPAAGSVLVGLTRTGSTPAVDVPGSALLVRITLRPVGGGTGPLAFQQPKLLNGATPPVEKSGISWSGGTLSAR